jgi:hypothetical protein
LIAVDVGVFVWVFIVVVVVVVVGREVAVEVAEDDLGQVGRELESAGAVARLVHGEQPRLAGVVAEHDRERGARLARQLQRDDDEGTPAEVDVADGANSLGAAAGGRLGPRERGQQGHGG